MLPRDHWRRIDDRLDPEADWREITRNTGAREFPWDTLRVLPGELGSFKSCPGGHETAWLGTF